MFVHIYQKINKVFIIIIIFIIIISTDEDPSLRFESSAIINLHGVSTKLEKYIVFTMQTYKKLTLNIIYEKILRKSTVACILFIYTLALVFLGLALDRVLNDEKGRSFQASLKKIITCTKLR